MVCHARPRGYAAPQRCYPAALSGGPPSRWHANCEARSSHATYRSFRPMECSYRAQVDQRFADRMATDERIEAWVAKGPVFFVFLGDARRLERIGEFRGKAIANGTLNGFFNATVDAALEMQTCILAAGSVVARSGSFATGSPATHCARARTTVSRRSIWLHRFLRLVRGQGAKRQVTRTQHSRSIPGRMGSRSTDRHVPCNHHGACYDI